jgi:hypothetical protein
MTTSSRSYAPARKVSIARRSAEEKGLIGEICHEKPVALVGRNPPGARVRLDDIALLFEHGHVVANSRGRDVQVVAVDERPGTNRLVGGHVVLDDGAQDRQLPVI